MSAASSTRSWNSDIADDPCDYGDPSYIAYTYDYEMRRARYGAHLLDDQTEVEEEEEEEGDRSQRRVGALAEREQEDDDEDEDEDAGRGDDSGAGDDLDLVFNIELH